MITGVMYNCKDEHLASISLNGDLILHNLASGAKAAELKDPNEQVSSSILVVVFNAFGMFLIDQCDFDFSYFRSFFDNSKTRF